jgi:hypothetical protein
MMQKDGTWWYKYWNNQRGKYVAFDVLQDFAADKRRLFRRGLFRVVVSTLSTTDKG